MILVVWGYKEVTPKYWGGCDKMQIKYNISKRTKPIKYIIIHDTGNKSKGANALSHYIYFNSADRQSSADFFIDDTLILQVNDYEKYYTWHSGKKSMNEISIGVEMCINTDGDYEKAFANTVECVKTLMKDLNIPIENVIRHYDVTKKNCPQSFNNGNWELWDKFKQKLVEGEQEMIYNYIDENMPEWAKATIQKLVDKGILQGNEKGELNLNDTMLRMLVINDRAGLY